MLFIFDLCGLISAISNRAMDPLVPSVARDVGVTVDAAALVVSIYALPYAFSQPVLGPLGDFYGKGRVLRACLWVLTASLVAVALAPTLTTLMIARFIGGVAGGGIMPIGMAMVGDRAPPARRQQAIARYVAASLLGLVFSSAAAGMLAAWVSWRVVFGVAAAISLVASILVTLYVREPPAPPRRMTLADGLGSYRALFANPRAFICFGAVFLEGMALYGTTPWIAPLFEQRQQGGPLEAGIVIMGFGVGAFLFTLTVSFWLRFFGRYQIMTAGGLVTSIGPFALALGRSWPWQLAAFTLTGFGYMMVHNAIQAEVAALAAQARASAFAMHSCFFFIGQSIGPLLLSAGAYAMGASAMLCVYGALLLALGPVVAALYRRTPSSEA